MKQHPYRTELTTDWMLKTLYDTGIKAWIYSAYVFEEFTFRHGNSQVGARPQAAPLVHTPMPANTPIPLLSHPTKHSLPVPRASSRSSCAASTHNPIVDLLTMLR